MPEINIGKHEKTLAAVLIIAVVLRILFFHGFFPSDQYYYSLFSADTIKLAGDIHLTPNPVSNRWGMIFPTAFFYWIFGVNEFSSTLWPVLCSLGTVIVGYLLGKLLSGKGAGLLAAFILAFFPLEIIYAGQLMADVPIGFWLILSLYFFLRGDKENAKAKKDWYYFMCGIALGVAYATKWIAVVVLPFFFFLSLLRRRIDWQLSWLAVGLAIILFFEYLMFAMTKGEGLYRISSILKSTSLRHEIGSLGEPTSIFTYLYWMVFDIHYVGLSFIILFITLPIDIMRRLIRTDSSTYSYWLLFLWGGLIFSILTIYPLSVRPYIPLYKQVNYMLMFTAPFLVGLGIILSQLSQRIRYISMFLVMLSCFPSLYISRESHLAHVDNLRAVRQFYQKHKDRPLYCTYETAAYLKYFESFKNNEMYKDFTITTPWLKQPRISQPIVFRCVYVVVDQYLLDYHTSRGDKFPDEILNPPSHWRVVFKYQREPYFRNALMNLINIMYEKGFVSSGIHKKIMAKMMNWSHSKPVIIYAAD